MTSTGIGERLRSARQALGLSLEEIENVTHIRRSYLEALEQESFDALPGPAYTRGFLRAYAACLGLPPQEFLDQYPATTPGEARHRESPVEVRITPALRLSPVRRAVMGVGLLVGLGVAFVVIVLYIQMREFALTAPERASPARNAPAGSPTAPSTTTTRPAPAAPAAPGGTPASRPGGTSSPAPPPAPPPGPTPATPPPPASPPAAVPLPPPGQPASPPPAPSAGAPARPAAPGPAATTPSAPQGAPPASPASPAPLNVSVVVSGHTWVRTVVDGTVAFEGFLNAGDRQSWQAKRSLSVTVGNAAVANIALNGKPVGPLGGPGQVYMHTFSSPSPAP